MRRNWCYLVIWNTETRSSPVLLNSATSEMVCHARKSRIETPAYFLPREQFLQDLRTISTRFATVHCSTRLRVDWILNHIPPYGYVVAVVFVLPWLSLRGWACTKTWIVVSVIHPRQSKKVIHDVSSHFSLIMITNVYVRERQRFWWRFKMIFIWTDRVVVFASAWLLWMRQLCIESIIRKSFGCL